MKKLILTTVVSGLLIGSPLCAEDKKIDVFDILDLVLETGTKIPKVEPKPEPIPEPEVKLTKEQLDKMLKEAEEKGFREGYKKGVRDAYQDKKETEKK